MDWGRVVLCTFPGGCGDVLLYKGVLLQGMPFVLKLVSLLALFVAVNGMFLLADYLQEHRYDRRSE